jgi:hypothetical protein
MSFASFVDDIAEFIGGAAGKIHDAHIFQNAARMGIRGVGKTAEFGAKTAFKGVNLGLKGVAAGVEFTREHGDDIWRGAKKFGKAVGEEGKTWGKAAFGAVEMIDRSPLVKEVGWGESLLKRQFTKPGVALVLGGGLAVGSAKAGKDYLNSRTGQHDGQIHRVAPTMSNPYDLSSQMAYSPMGQSFANNAGADGDLALALSKMR